MIAEEPPAEPSRPRTARWIWLAIALLSLLGVAQGLLAERPAGSPILFDERRFRLYATNLADRGFFGDEAGKWPATVELRSVGYSAYLPPGYPFFIAAFKRSIGGFGLVPIAQAVLAGATIGLASLIALRLFGSVAAVATGVLLLATGVLGTYSRLVLSEILATTLLTASVALLLAAFDRRSWILTAASGVLFGAGALARPQLLLIPLGLAVWLFFAVGRRRAGAVAAIALIGGVLVAVIPWTVRNYARLDTFVPISTYTWVNFWIVNNPKANGQFQIPERFIGEQRVREIRSLPEVEQDLEWRGLAMDWVRGDPSAAFRGWVRNGRIFLAEEDVIIPMYYGYRWGGFPRLDERLLMPLAIGGLLVALGSRIADRRIWPLVLVVVYFIAFFSIFLPDGRYRVPMLPLLAVLASAVPAGCALIAGRLLKRTGEEAPA